MTPNTGTDRDRDEDDSMAWLLNDESPEPLDLVDEFTATRQELGVLARYYFEKDADIEAFCGCYEVAETGSLYVGRRPPRARASSSNSTISPSSRSTTFARAPSSPSRLARCSLCTPSTTISTRCSMSLFFPLAPSCRGHDLATRLI